MRIGRRAGQLEVWRDDLLLFSEARRREDRAFAEFALAPITGRDDLAITIAGLGTGLLLRGQLRRQQTDAKHEKQVQLDELLSQFNFWHRQELSPGAVLF